MCVCVCEKLEINPTVWKMYNDRKAQGLQSIILFIGLFVNVLCFGLLDLYQGVWIIKRNEIDEKILKHSISVGSFQFQICVM